MSTPPPDPEAMLAALGQQHRDRPLGDAESRMLHRPTQMQVSYGIDSADLGMASGIMHPPGTPTAQHVTSPFSAIPVAASHGEYWETISIYAHESGVFMDPDDLNLYPASGPSAGYHYQNLAATPMPWTGPGGSTGAPAPINEVPTSTTNPERPRTVAAGYDKQRKCLTVVFRDGTYYNYYEVSALQWANFKRARSKGRFILTYLDSHPRGVADVATLPSGARETLYRLSRTGQVKREGLTGKQRPGTKAGARGTYRPGNLGGTGRKRNKPKGTP